MFVSMLWIIVGREVRAEEVGGESYKSFNKGKNVIAQ